MDMHTVWIRNGYGIDMDGYDMDMDMVSVRKTNFTFNQSALEHMVGRNFIQSIFKLSGSWAFLSACDCFC